MDNMYRAFRQLLERLPECSCDIAALCRGADYFSLDHENIIKAAELLPENHELEYKGVRLLLSACLEEFEELFSEAGPELCEVTVPAPSYAIYALQAAAHGKIRFVSSAFFAQIALRGILLDHAPLDLNSCAKRHCGLNAMRRRLLTAPPEHIPKYQMQFGVLCDECVKTGEMAGNRGRTLSVCFPEREGSACAKAGEFYNRACEAMGIDLKKEHVRRGFSLYRRLTAAESEIERLCADENRLLWGNSFALAQSVQLMSSNRIDRFIQALELLAEELKAAPAGSGEKRIYCFYIPFLQPEIDRRFRKNGVQLVGGAAFLHSGKHLGFDLAGMTEAWLDDMCLRAGTERQCEAIAKAMQKYGCETYLTGSFGFDRRLGAAVPMQRKILREQYGVETKLLDADFWCENAMFGNVLERVDQICMK